MRDAITLSNSELMELTRRANSRTNRAEDARRARLILLLADGHTWDEVSERIDCSRGFVASWSKRFTEQRIAGLYSRHLGQVATVLTPELEARILEATRRAPTSGATHWSTRKLGAHLDVSHMMVARVWHKHGLQPHRIERYMASNDPHFEKKAADIIGLYLNPPAHAAVFSVDEKTAIQALDRKDPVLPLSPGRAERHGFAVRCLQHQDRRSPRQNRGAAHLGRIRRVPHRHCYRSTSRQGDSCDRRQSLCSQEQTGHGLPGNASQSSLALHSDLLFVAESSRAVVQQDRARCHRARCIHFRL